MPTGESCQICGHQNESILEEHHLIPARRNGPDSDENLVTVCPNCHKALENIYDRSFWELVEKRDIRREPEQAKMSEEELHEEANEIWGSE